MLFLEDQRFTEDKVSSFEFLAPQSSCKFLLSSRSWFQLETRRSQWRTSLFVSRENTRIGDDLVTYNYSIFCRIKMDDFLGRKNRYKKEMMRKMKVRGRDRERNRVVSITIIRIWKFQRLFLWLYFLIKKSTISPLFFLFFFLRFHCNI